MQHCKSQTVCCFCLLWGYKSPDVVFSTALSFIILIKILRFMVSQQVMKRRSQNCSWRMLMTVVKVDVFTVLQIILSLVMIPLLRVLSCWSIVWALADRPQMSFFVSSRSIRPIDPSVGGFRCSKELRREDKQGGWCLAGWVARSHMTWKHCLGWKRMNELILLWFS